MQEILCKKYVMNLNSLASAHICMYYYKQLHMNDCTNQVLNNYVAILYC